MKKICVSLLIMLLTILMLFSCATESIISSIDDENKSLVTVVFSDGSTKNMSVQELIDLYNNDGRKFEEIKLIKGEGKVTDVGSIEQAGWDYDTKRPTAWDVDIDIGKDIVLNMFVNDPSDVPELYNGDIVEFSASCIGLGEFEKLYVRYHYQIEGHYVNLKK